MGKNKNKKNQKRVIENKAETMDMLERDSEGFVPLKPTSSGQAKLDEIKARKSKVSAQPTYEPSKPVGDDAETAYDPKPMSEMLDALEDLVKVGKYGKGMETVSRDITDEFVIALGKLDPTSDSPDVQSMFGMARKLLAIAKSYYEYDPKSRNLINDKTYDRLLATYLKTGKPEPVGIIPKGMKDLKKVKIKYPTLHNNVDKAYIIHENDSIPEGVKETDSVEAFLRRVFKETDTPLEGKISIELSPKIDGVSLNGTVLNGLLVDPQTRGDDDESVAVMGANGMQLTNGFKEESPFGIQYEAFVTKEDRVKASEYLRLDQTYVSCRHAAAGIIHRLSTVEDDGLLQFISLYPIASEGLDGTYEERMDYLQNFGIVPKDMPKRKIFRGTFEELMKRVSDYYHDMMERREDLSFAIDGVVITVVDDEYQEILGRSGRTNKFQIAFKFDPANAVAQVSGITLDSGKKGFRTVQVQLKHPVYLDGVEYDHVPVLSVPLFEALNLRVGSKVNVHRVGDVIPSISVLEEGHGYKIHLPTTCPSCGERLIIRNKKLFCGNLECKDNLIGLFTHFFESMGLDGYSDSFSAMLVNTMKCKNLMDVLHLSDECFKRKGVNSVLAVGFVQKLKDAIAAHRDYEVLGAMGLPGVGPAKAKILLEKLADKPRSDIFKSYGPTLRAACAAAVGPEQADTLECYLVGPLFGCSWRAVEPLIKNITKDFSKVIRVGHTGGALSKKTLDIIRENGFDVVDGSSFDILITSSMSRSSGKMNAAKKKGLPIFLEDDFCEKYSKDVIAPAS